MKTKRIYKTKKCSDNECVNRYTEIETSSPICSNCQEEWEKLVKDIERERERERESRLLMITNREPDTKKLKFLLKEGNQKITFPIGYYQ